MGARSTPSRPWAARCCAVATVLLALTGGVAPARAQTKDDAAQDDDEARDESDKDEPTLDAGAVAIDIGTDGEDSEGSTGWLADDYHDLRARKWFQMARPLIEIHGYYRVRSNLFHNFSLGRADARSYDPLTDQGTPTLWPRPPTDSYVDTAGNRTTVGVCGSASAPAACRSNVQAGANMRLRVEPTISVSDNLKIHTQLDMLDNVILGSTPEGYINQPDLAGGYQVIGRSGYAPLGFSSSTQWAPVGALNSPTDSVLVKRAWGEYKTPIGARLRFGRMPNHWGLGMVHNAGNGYDADWQSDVDRVMASYGVPDWGLYLSAAFDYGIQGPTSTALHGEVGVLDGSGGEIPGSAASFEQNGERFDLLNTDEVTQYTVMLVYSRDEQLARLRLAQGWPVVNAGFYFSYQKMLLANETPDQESGASLLQSPFEFDEGLVRRGYSAVQGDLWAKVRYRKFRAEVEAAFNYGSLQNTEFVAASGINANGDYDNERDPSQDGWRIRQFGFVAETELETLEDRLRLGFDVGFATGDSDLDNLSPTVSPGSGSSLPRQLTPDRTYSTFRFHPNYRVDLILWRNILTRVQGAYFFRPTVSYDFLREPDGQRLGGGFTMVYSRATEAVQTPGHSADLGLEFDFKLLYQLSPGRPPSSDVRQMGGFYTALEYGLLVPLDGLGYLPGQQASYVAAGNERISLSPAQMARWYLGIYF